MLHFSNELRAKLNAAKNIEEVTEIVRADGQEATTEEASQLWKEIESHRTDSELSLEELEAVSGGADRNWATEGCAATVEYGSWCGSNDKCIIRDVTYDFQPTGHLCPNCVKNMYKQNTISLGGGKYEDQYRCKYCGCIKSEIYTDSSSQAK